MDVLQQNNYLTSLATGSISYPPTERRCPICSSLQFKGEALYIEIRCRRCKTMLLFQREEIRPHYSIQPY